MRAIFPVLVFGSMILSAFATEGFELEVHKASSDFNYVSFSVSGKRLLGNSEHAFAEIHIAQKTHSRVLGPVSYQDQNSMPVAGVRRIVQGIASENSSFQSLNLRPVSSRAIYQENMALADTSITLMDATGLSFDEDMASAVMGVQRGRDYQLRISSRADRRGRNACYLLSVSIKDTRMRVSNWRQIHRDPARLFDYRGCPKDSYRIQSLHRLDNSHFLLIVAYAVSISRDQDDQMRFVGIIGKLEE